MLSMSTWAEIRHMHLTRGVAKKEVARRFGVNIKTVRRAIERSEAPTGRVSPARERLLDPQRERILELLKADPKITAKRIARILEPETGRLAGRTIRRYIQELRGSLRSVEGFVHRTHVPGETMEVDFGEAWATIGGCRAKVHFMVAALPASNSYFVKAYALERTECLLDGIASAFVWFGGVTTRAVLDNTSLAVKKVLKGPDRIETKRFEAFRGEWPLHVDFCTPASGWEKGSTERGVRYVRDLCFRPEPTFENMEALNAYLIAELEADLERRKLPDGRSAQEALTLERAQLRPLPARIPDTALVVPCVADKYGLVRVDRSSYSVPTRFSRRSVVAHIYHDRIELAVEAEIVGVHRRSTRREQTVIDLEHVIDVLEHKPRAAIEATAIRQLGLPKAFYELRAKLREERRKSDKEWVQVIRLLLEHTLTDLQQAIETALKSGTPGLASITQILRQESSTPMIAEPMELDCDNLAGCTVPDPDLASWDQLCMGVAS